MLFRSIEFVRQADKVFVSIFQHDILSECSPGRKAWLKLVWADLLVTTPAERALPAAAHKGSGHPVALLPFVDVSSNRFDDSCKLVTGDMGKCDVWIVPPPSVPVTPAHSCSFDANDDPGWTRCRVRDGSDLDRSPEFGVEGGLQ